MRAIKGLQNYKQTSSNDSIIYTESTTLSVKSLSEKALAERAYLKLRDIFSEHFGNALLEAGEYIYKIFFGGNIQAVRDKKPAKEASFRKLCEMLGQRDDGAPSRSWLNNAVRLHISILELEQNTDVDTVQAFGQLSTSHKLQIIRLPAIKAQISFIKRSVNKKGEVRWSVRKLKEAIDKHLKVQPSVPGLPQLINRPEKLFSDDFTGLLNKDYLAALKPKTIRAIRKKFQAVLDSRQ